jgi:hypothetical protein
MDPSILFILRTGTDTREIWYVEGGVGAEVYVPGIGWVVD